MNARDELNAIATQRGWTVADSASGLVAYTRGTVELSVYYGARGTVLGGSRNGVVIGPRGKREIVAGWLSESVELDTDTVDAEPATVENTNPEPTHVIACQVDQDHVDYYAINTETRDTVGGPFPTRDAANAATGQLDATTGTDDLTRRFLVETINHGDFHSDIRIPLENTVTGRVSYADVSSLLSKSPYYAYSERAALNVYRALRNNPNDPAWHGLARYTVETVEPMAPVETTPNNESDDWEKMNLARPRALTDVMEFGHPITVLPDGRVFDASRFGVDAPESAYDGSDDEHEFVHVEGWEEQGWELLRNWTGQYGYNGPVMHPSEFIGGRLAAHILTNPGHYVAIVVNGDDPDDDEPTGWAIAHKSLDMPESVAYQLDVHGQRSNDLFVAAYADACGNSGPYWQPYVDRVYVQMDNGDEPDIEPSELIQEIEETVLRAQYGLVVVWDDGPNIYRAADLDWIPNDNEPGYNITDRRN
ncbi:hypothetical protein L3Y21_gp098 [Gordonia phage Rabbitrun]|uniref:Uncharacterized protein n=1 Tax=Gordonia phage Rabbitrun TaxID=2762280 RepID=A0A7G8LIU6_9CAUD|nr:hypothetical protein L3Y21_gp098 [Gordonia phage Rabbitrun]QNJ57168.1 hypothetical protein SEA_RABBITRUN_138 [Gordonia phage Rabbitrun]